jgi:Xaa-Pro dipeptidase
MYANGAEWISHHFITVNSPAGLFQAGGAHVWKGGTVKADLGCYATGGYAGDLCRVRFVGEPDPAVVNAYAGLLDAQRTVIAAAKPGTSCASIATDLNAGLRKRGLTMTPYAMGHGIGLRAMELPSIYRDDLMASDDRLETGMVLCIEPSTTVQVDGETIKVANEDQYVVEADGLRQITLIGSAID